MVLVQAVVLRDRIETVRDAVEEQAGHVGVTVIEAVGHGRQRGVTHEYRGRVFESRFLPKAVMQFVVSVDLAEHVADVVCDAARTGEIGSGIVITIPLGPTRHIRTGLTLEEFGE
jgi:nitrogen regulatory protein P-II 1